MGARFALIVAALGLGAMFKDKKGLGSDLVLRGATGLIGLGGVIWAGWAAIKARLSRRT